MAAFEGWGQVRKPFDKLEGKTAGFVNMVNNECRVVPEAEANAAIAADKAHAEQVVSEMGAKVAELTQRLAEARGVIEFYASKENWESDDASRSTGNKTFDVCLFDFDRNLEPKKDYAGAKARAYLEKAKG